MAKETAHQIATPLSSLMAWIELIKDDKNEDMVFEMKKDLKNLLLDRQISQLESKFSEDMDQTTLDEIIELKKLQNNN